jgi:hypothetical protein
MLLVKRGENKDMEKETAYPYPVPEFIEHLDLMQELLQHDEKIYSSLARLLEICHATVEHANAIWKTQRFLTEGPEMPTQDALGYALSRLVPVILRCAVGGWNELMMYIENHEDYPWYDPNEEYPVLPPRLGTPERAEWERAVQDILAQEAEMV